MELLWRVVEEKVADSTDGGHSFVEVSVSSISIDYIDCIDYIKID